jgi:acetyl-CoA carboxylase carboxyltransferase component
MSHQNPVDPQTPPSTARTEDTAGSLAGGNDRIERRVSPSLESLLDPGSWRALDPHLKRRPDRYGAGKVPPEDGLVAGFGKVEGRRLALFLLGGAEDGAFSEMGAQKVGQLLVRARQGGLPVVGVYRSTGLAPQEGLYGWAGPPELLWQQTQCSGLVPQIALVAGPVPGALALSVGLADFVVRVAKEGRVSLRPEAALHDEERGLAHFVVAGEAGAMRLVRRLLSYLPCNNLEAPPYVAPTDDPWRMEVALDTLVPQDPSLPYDAQTVIDAVFDRGSFLEVQADFARNAIVGLARLHGAVVGVVAQQPTVLAGVLDIDASDKLARFIRTCDAFNLPVELL